VSIQVQEKAFKLGYTWGYGGNTPGNIFAAELFFNTDGSIRWAPRGYIDREPFERTLISYQDFLNLGETTQTTQIMSEITLKCTKAPQKAKNITADKNYTGILIDSDDTQVDTLEEAKFFQCVNNNGIEAKYKLTLFEAIAPPAPAKLTQAQLIEKLEVHENSVSVNYNGEDVTIFPKGWSDLSNDPVSCSCGIHSSDGLNELFFDLNDIELLDVETIIEDFDRDELVDEIFKAIVLARIQNTKVALMLFSTTSEDNLVTELMDWLAENQGGYATESHLNPNSENDIKAWLIPKN